MTALSPVSSASPASAPAGNLLEVRDLAKAYGPVAVITGVSFDVPRHSVVTLVGENGAGKSTIFNILSGLTRADSGTIALKGTPYRPANNRTAVSLGVTRVFQEQSLVHNVPVYENLLIGEEWRYTRYGQWVDRKAMIRAARGIIDAAGLDVDVERRTGDYDFSTRQSVEIARACLTPGLIREIEEPLILLDEPTSALDRRDEEAFFGLVNRMRRHGSLLFVSHRMAEVLQISDVIYVLKDGELVARERPEETDEHRLHGLMVGRERASDYYYEARQKRDFPDTSAFRAEGIRLSSDAPAITLDVRPGEILGIGGLLDSGKSELGKAIAGVAPPQAGTISFGGKNPHRPDIRRATREGLGYIPAERLAEGIIPAFPVTWNLTAGSGGDLFSNATGIWRQSAEKAAARKHIEALAIRSARPETPMQRLSGGNQQKVVLARWLERTPDVLVLDNPTRGVDAGAKQEIYRVLRDLTDRGVAIILITDELLELIGLSNRILIMQRGQIVAEVTADPDAKPTEQALVAAMLPDSAHQTGASDAAASVKIQEPAL